MNIYDTHLHLLAALFVLHCDQLHFYSFSAYKTISFCWNDLSKLKPFAWQMNQQTCITLRLINFLHFAKPPTHKFMVSSIKYLYYCSLQLFRNYFRIWNIIIRMRAAYTAHRKVYIFYADIHKYRNTRRSNKLPKTNNYPCAVVFLFKWIPQKGESRNDRNSIKL